MQSIISNVFKIDKKNNVNEFSSNLFNHIYLFYVNGFKLYEITIDYLFIIFC